MAANTDPVTSGLTLLYRILSGDSTFMALVTGVFQDIAPETSAGKPQAPDYAIIGVQAPGEDTLGAGAYRLLSQPTFLVKLVGPTVDMANLHAAYARADALLALIRNDSATGILACYRTGAFGLAEPQLIDGKPWYNLGGLYKMAM